MLGRHHRLWAYGGSSWWTYCHVGDALRREQANRPHVRTAALYEEPPTEAVRIVRLLRRRPAVAPLSCGGVGRLGASTCSVGILSSPTCSSVTASTALPHPPPPPPITAPITRTAPARPPTPTATQRPAQVPYVFDELEA